MSISMVNVGIAVRDLEAAIAFFTDLGLTVIGRDEVSGEWADTAVGLDGNHAKIALLQTPEGDGQVELFEYIHPLAIDTNPRDPTRSGCIACLSRSTTSKRLSRSPLGTAATPCVPSRYTGISTSSPTCAARAASS